MEKKRPKLVLQCGVTHGCHNNKKVIDAKKHLILLHRPCQVDR